MVSHNQQYWRLDQFNLICYTNTDNPIFKNPTGRAVFDSTRMFEYTAPAIKDHYQADITKLAYLPTVVVAELGNASFTGSVVPARLTRISNVHNEGNSTVFEYRHLDDNITSDEIFDSGLFPLGRFETSRTHWAVKEGDLLYWLSERR